MADHKFGLGKLLPGVVSLLVLGMASAAPAQSILSLIQVEPDGSAPVHDVVVTTPGVLASGSWGSAEARALTDYGVNKIYAASDGASEQHATSAWLDSYTVSGTGLVELSFTFSIDGLADFTSMADSNFNFAVYALRGNGWSLGGYPDNDFDRMFVEMTRPDGGITQMTARDFDGFYNYQANPVTPSEPGALSQHVQLIGNGAGSYYSMISTTPALTERRFYADRYETYVGGVLNAAQSGSYTDGRPLSATFAATRANLVNGYSLLDMAVLCDGGTCDAGAYPGSDLTLSFSLQAGSTFSLVSMLYADDVNQGMVDFFHTAKVTGITVSGGATLASQSGTLQMASDGSYGYAAVAALPTAPGAVPEPATWALMIGGLAMAGGLMRRRATLALAA